MLRSIGAAIRAILSALRTELQRVWDGTKFVMRLVAAPFAGGPDALPEPPQEGGAPESVEDKVKRLKAPDLAEVVLAYARTAPWRRAQLPDLDRLAPQDKAFVLNMSQDDIVKVIRDGHAAAMAFVTGKPAGESHADKLARLKARYASKTFSDGPELEDEGSLAPAFR